MQLDLETLFTMSEAGLLPIKLISCDNVDNVLDQNYVDHLLIILGQIPVLLALTLMILILTTLKVK